MSKAKMSINSTVSELKSELRSKVETNGYISNSDFKVEDDGNTVCLSIRALGKWENPSDARDEEDYDWQELRASSKEQIRKVVTKVQSESGRKITWSEGEKNWVCFKKKKKKGE